MVREKAIVPRHTAPIPFKVRLWLSRPLHIHTVPLISSQLIQVHQRLQNLSYSFLPPCDGSPPHSFSRKKNRARYYSGRSSSSFLFARRAYIYLVCVRSADICPRDRMGCKPPSRTQSQQSIGVLFKTCMPFSRHICMTATIHESASAELAAVTPIQPSGPVRIRIQLRTVGIIFTRLTALVHQPHAKSKVSPVRELWMNFSTPTLHVIFQLTYLLDGPRRCFS